jgi:2,4-dienoyl-CoA reductase-like NADH-dependent reductase (Old Yellow Enzyme family)/thioredoxin reductase
MPSGGNMKKFFPRLFAPGRLGGLEVKNRIVMAPLTTFMAHDWAPTSRMIEFYSARARGGAGLIIVEPASVVDLPPGAICLRIDSDDYIPGLKRLAAAAKRTGARAAIQLLPPSLGRRMKTGSNQPRPIMYGHDAFTEVTKEDLDYCEGCFARAAVRALEAGFDAVEFHAAHGTFLSSFLSPFSNRRKDEYGGNAANRARLMCEIVALARRQTGPEYPLIVRLSASEYMEGGTTPEQTIVHGKLLAEAGATALHITGGNQHRLQWHAPPYFIDPAPFLHHARKVKQAVDVPVIAVGRINDLSIGERALAEDTADFIALGRPLLADPDLPNKAQKGRLDEIRPCIYCNNCHSAIFGHPEVQKQGLSCTVNPGLLQEAKPSLKPAAKRKRVMVVGGGLAGMEAARVLAERGHTVTLYEKADRLGGQWNIACADEWKERDFTRLTAYMVRGVRRAGVEVRLNAEVSSDLVASEKPEVVIVATGALPVAPDVPGVDGRNVVQANDVFAGKARCGHKVVVVGGRYLGMEVAGLLARQGKAVSLVDLQPIGADTGITVYAGLIEEMVKHGVRFYPNSPLYEIREKGAYIQYNNELLLLEADTVVLAAGVTPQKHVFEKLKGSVKELYAIGDCADAGPRNAMGAIQDGAEVGRSI